MKRSLFAALGGLLLAMNVFSASAASDVPVLAKYYAWFDENSWGPGKMADQPSQSYRSAERSTIERQVSQAQSAGIDGFELNWWGPDNQTDENLRTLLAVAKAKGFKVTVDFDLNSPLVNGPGETAQALSYLNRYFSDPAWFRYDGRPVVSFYGIRKYDVGTWAAIRAQAGGDALWVGEGDNFGYLKVFDGMHPYSVAWSPDPSSQLASYASRTRAYGDKMWVATVMPGYNDTLLGRGSAAFAVDRRGGDYYRNLWQGALATRPAFIAITSWNEWPEGSQIEPGKGYGDLYLQITRDVIAGFRGDGLASKAVAPVSATAAPPAPQSGCAFTMGFAALRAVVGDVVGSCLENERHNPENGDALQQTTRGLMVWRKSDNFTAFTDGARTWVNGPLGLQQRANSERFSWEKG